MFVLVYFWAVYSVLLMYVSILLPIPCCLRYCGFIVRLEIRQCESSKFVLFLNIVMALLSLPFHIILRNILSVSTKMLAGVFDWGSLNVMDQFGKNWHLDNIESLNSWKILIFDFFQQNFVVFWYRSCIWFVKFIPNVSFLFGAFVDGIFFF